MKVAYVLPDLQKPGGWRHHALGFLGAIRQYVEPVLFVAAQDEQFARSLFPGDNIYSLPVTQNATFSRRRGAVQLLACRAAIARGRWPDVDLVHALEAYPAGLVGSWLGERLNRPYVLTIHGTYGVVWHERRLDRLAYRQVLRKASLVCPVSTGTAELVQQYFGSALAGTPVQPILNGNDYFQWVPQSWADSRPEPAIPTLLSVGDVKPRKGLHISLAAFARVKEQLPEARYWIAGSCKSDAYFRRLEAIIARHQIQDVTFLGRVSDAELQRLYQEASLFVLTPQADGLHFEGFGLVYLEAGAYGLPVVATRTGGVPDAVRHGETGLLAAPDDVDGIAQSILRLLSDPGLSRSLGQANRRWAETLTWDRTAAEQFAAYQAVLGIGERVTP